MNLNKILDDLSKYKNNSDKEEVLKKYIQIRLTKSLDSYYKELDKSINYFYSRKQSRCRYNGKQRKWRICV